MWIVCHNAYVYDRVATGRKPIVVRYTIPARARLAPCTVRWQQTHTKCVMASFLAKLSWHDDNKIQMYQAAEEVIKVLKRFLADAHSSAIVCSCLIVKHFVRPELDPQYRSHRT